MRIQYCIMAFAALLSCAAGAATTATAASMTAPGDRAWVEMAPDGGTVVRLLTMAPRCPDLSLDGRSMAMRERAAPGQLPSRPNKAQVATGPIFPAMVCELAVPRGTRHAFLRGARLPLPPTQIDRIVVIGDTGCRLKDSDKAWQACDIPANWPFAAIAARAAALHPDMVLHVGDYLYRESPCPDGDSGCAGAAWGYGEAGWRADFLDPAAPLLAVAPWAMVRGNHEECARAGQGWWRLLDPHPLIAGRDCADPANDLQGNHTDPYPVDLGGGARLIVADLMELASGKPSDPAVAEVVRGDLARIETLAQAERDSFVTAHYPFNAVVWEKGNTATVMIGTKPVNAFQPLQLSGVRAMLAGHVHLFQFARFNDRPTQVVTGFSGTEEDLPIAPASLAEAQGKPGSDPLRALTTIAGRFGYALLERDGRNWRLTAFAADGSVMGQFTL